MKNLTIFLLMGIIYICIEVFFSAIYDAGTQGLRLVGQSSIWMFVEGGLIGVLLGSLNNTKKLYIKYPWDIVAGGLIITACELTSGIVLNRWLGFNIWDYSHAKYNFLGQIDLLHSTCWFILSPIVFWLDDVIRFYMFNEKRPASLGAYFVRSVDRT